MKLNKLAIAMGLASVVLTGCDHDRLAPAADFTITAIDGYIVNGLVTTTCNDGADVFTGRTNELGLAPIFSEGIDLSNCTSKITGDAQTYDTAAPNVAWLHTMAALPGQAVINPYTDIAAIIVANNPSLSDEEVMAQVVTLLNIPADVVAGGVNLFADYGSNNAGTGLDAVSLAKISVLAQSTFSAITKLKAALPANATPAQAQALYASVLPKITAVVAAKITELGENNLSGEVFASDFTLPTIEFNEDGSLSTDLTDLTVEVVVVTPVDPTGTGTGTGTGSDGVNQG